MNIKTDYCLYHSTVFSGVENRFPCSLSLKYGNKMKSLGTKSELYGGWRIISMFWVHKYSVVRWDVWELAMSWWSMTNDCVPFKIDRSTLLKWYCGHITNFYEETDDHLHCFKREQLFLDFRRLLFSFRLIRIDLWFCIST